MPFVRIDLTRDIPEAIRVEIADAVHDSLVEAVGIPADDRFQVISGRETSIIHDRNYLGIQRSDQIVMIEIHLSVGRGVEIKKALYAALHRRLVGLGLRGEDIFVHLVETLPANWSFGNGEAQYADRMPAHLPPTPVAAE